MVNRPLLRPLKKLLSKSSVITITRLAWTFAVIWWELGSFYWNVAWCHWPRQLEPSVHILLIADPQVPRPYKSWLVGPTWFKQYIVNHSLRKSWNAAKSLRPQIIIFLGDMLRHGSKGSSLTEYSEYVSKFRSIFKTKSGISTYYVPGNRDVGLGYSPQISAELRTRYETYFGPPNQFTPTQNHTLIFLDAPALVEEDYRRHGAGYKFNDWESVSGGSIDFVKSVAATREDLPVILFTHIPLWRPEGASCGPLREYGTIRRGVGKGYQSLLGKETSKFLLDNVRPSIIFSADDHDYCEYLHPVTDEDPLDHQPIPEVTVKSFSMATKLKRPGFQLLSLSMSQNDTLASPSFSHSQCLLPDQSSIYTHGYSFPFFFTIVLFIILNSRRSKPPRLNDHLVWSDHRFQTIDSTSPGRRSPPASPIHYKSSSRSRMIALRGASSLPVTTSEPATPLGGSPFLSPSFPQPIDDEDSQELLIWQSQLDAPKQSPYVKEQSREMDSSYFLPSPGLVPKSTVPKNIWKQSVITRATCHPWSFSKLAMLSLIIAPSTWSTGSRRARTWYGRCLQDIFQVFLLPFLVYFMISLWLYL